MNKREGKQRKLLMLIGLSTNIGLLFYYKYYFNFISEVFGLLDLKIQIEKPVFPIGISFYIFQSLSYIIDVYKKDTEPVKNFFVYTLYVTFFPQLVIGPIEKGRHLIPQFKNLKFIGIEKSEESIHLILYGLFKKVYVGNSLGMVIDNGLSLNNIDLANTIFLSIMTTFRIYADFSGYSDIARGIAKLLNIDLTLNFLPFFRSKNPSQFWSAWHLSLTSWVREYLFSALAGKRPTAFKFYIALLASFLIIGVWHGPTINWVVFGLFHGLVVISYRLLRKLTWFNYIPSSFGYTFMLFFYTISGFLHNNTELSKYNFAQLFDQSYNEDFLFRNLAISSCFIIPLLIFDSIQLKMKDHFFLKNISFSVRYAVYILWFVVVLIFNHSNKNFIYYQF